MEEKDWLLSPNDKLNSTRRFYRVGSSKHELASELPNATGLFGRSMSLASRYMALVPRETGFRFKALVSDDPYRMMSDGEPYDYRNDIQYRDYFHNALGPRSGRRISNFDFLTRLFDNGLVLLPEFIADLSFFGRGPEMAPEPNEKDRIGYVWPSYVIWQNDPSYTSFVGSPDFLELPKHVLRETRGHPRQDTIPPQYYRPRFSDRWQI